MALVEVYPNDGDARRRRVLDAINDVCSECPYTEEEAEDGICDRCMVRRIAENMRKLEG